MRNIFTKVAATAAVLAAFTTGAQAVPYVELRITDLAETAVGSGIFTVVNATASCSTETAASIAACGPTFIGLSGAPGIQVSESTLLFFGTVGNFTITSTTAEANIPGTSLEAFQNRSQTSAVRNADLVTPGLAHRLVVDFRAFGFTNPNGGFKTLSGSAGMTANDGASFAGTDTLTTLFTVDKDNGLAATASRLCTLTGAADKAALIPLNESCGLPQVEWTDTNAPASLFSMRSQQQFDIAVGSNINSTANSIVRNVPEPMTTSLVAVALLGLGLASRRSTKKA